MSREYRNLLTEKESEIGRLKSDVNDLAIERRDHDLQHEPETSTSSAITGA